MAESYSVKAVLSAVDRGFSSTLKNCSSALDRIDSKISGFSFGILTGAGQAAFNAITNGVTGLVSEIDSSNAAWKNFSSNMEILGKGEKEISGVKKELQEFAQQTVYSSSDMASTYAQLAAVGTKNTTQLVKGFGGLAAAAENPQQAMKTLSQQATQMAAKPSVAWADFKLMLEQTPAGIAAVAKHMGMSTSEMVTAVQSGEIATEDFFNAIAAVGGDANGEFQKMATEAKTVGQAMDGLKETVGNKLTPAFDLLSKEGINAVNMLADKLAGINAEQLAGKVMIAMAKVKRSLTKAVEIGKKYYTAFKEAFDGVGSKVKTACDAIRTSLGVALSDTETIDGFKGAMQTVADIIKKIADLATKHADSIAKLIVNLPKIAIALKGFKIAKTVAPFVSTFTSGIASLASKGIGGIAGKLFGISKSQDAVGQSSAKSSANMFTAAKSYAMMGVAVLTVAAGFALLAFSAIQLTNAGGPAIGVMAGLVIGLAGIGVGMAMILKSLAPMSAQLMPAAKAMLALGVAVLLVSAGFALLSYSSVQLANSGGLAIGVMAGMVAAIAGLAVGAAALAPALAAGAAGLTAFGVAVLLIGAGALIASAGMALLSSSLPVIAQYGSTSAAAIAELGAAMLIFSVGATAAGAASLILGTGLLSGSVGALAMAAALTGVSSQMKTIASNAESAMNSLAGMQGTISLVESGLEALGGKAKTALEQLMAMFNGSATGAQTAGANTGTMYAMGMQLGLVNASAVAKIFTVSVVTILRSGRPGAYQAGAYISDGFAAGMRSRLAEIKRIAAEMVRAAEKAIRAKAMIASPSKLTKKLGAFYGEGFAIGIADMARATQRAAQELVSIPQVATPNFATAYGYEMSGDYEYYRNAQYVVEVPLTVDGREFARATATYTQDELNRQQTRDSRKKGRV